MIGKRNIFNTSSSLVLIDEGHGNNTPDKRSPIWENGTQLFEWEFNRFVGDSFTKLLNLGKISNIKILTEIEDISLPERKERIMKLYTEYKDKYFVYLVSIHGNDFHLESVNGIEVFTSHENDDSDWIADVYLKSLSKLGRKMRYDESDGDLDKEANFSILRTICPSILTENGFYTNEKECAYMMSLQGRNEISYRHYEAAKTIELNLTLLNK